MSKWSFFSYTQFSSHCQAISNHFGKQDIKPDIIRVVNAVNPANHFWKTAHGGALGPESGHGGGDEAEDAGHAGEPEVWDENVVG